MDTKTGYDMGHVLTNDLVAIKPTWEGTQYTTVPTTLSSTETPIYLVAYSGNVQLSQLAVYLEMGTGGTTGTFNYYESPDNGTTWYPVSLFSTSTGVLSQRSVVLSSASFTYSSKYWGQDTLPATAMTMLLITGTSAASTPAYTCVVMGRNN
jgi:hypothetical protein